MSDSQPRQLPKGTRERLAACAAVGLSYWSDHPKPKHVWAVDDRQQAHVVLIHRDGTAQHVCGSATPVAVPDCPGDGDAVPYLALRAKPPGAA